MKDEFQIRAYAVKSDDGPRKTSECNILKAYAVKSDDGRKMTNTETRNKIISGEEDPS